MSILAATTQPSLPDPRIIIAGSLLFAASIVGIAYKTRLFRPGSLTLADRLPRERSGWLLFVVTVVGTGVWMGSQVGYLIIRSVASMAQGEPPPATQELDPARFTPIDYAFLSTLPALVGLTTLVIADWMLGGPGIPRGLGYDRWKMPRGVALGALAMVATLPLMYSSSIGLEALYRLVQFDHPKEHELLEALGKSTQPAIRGLIVAGAVVGAPLFEELLFRAHLQTTLRRLGLWLALGEWENGPRLSSEMSDGRPSSPPATSPGEFATGPTPPFSAPNALSDRSLPQPQLQSAAETAVAVPPRKPLAYIARDIPPAEPTVPLPAWPSWAAILITSIVFALVHPMWTAPLIFTLSLCLGYAYERTGNLWVSITMHAIFNGVSTTMVLMGLTDG